MKLTLDPRNANRGTTRGGHALEASLERLGAGRSIVADKNGTIIGGNKTYEKAQELGIATREVHTSGDELIVVVRDDLELDVTPKARELAYADNRVAELDLEWDEDLVAEDYEAVDLSFLWRPEESELWAQQGEDESTIVDFEEEDEPPAQRPRMYPLAIVLDKDEMSEWNTLKGEMKQGNDKKLLMKLMRDR